jgi:hypothetical protein
VQATGMKKFAVCRWHFDVGKIAAVHFSSAFAKATADKLFTGFPVGRWILDL